MEDVGTSTHELQTVLQIADDLAVTSHHEQYIDEVLEKLHGILPFDRCVLLHEHPSLNLTSAFIYECGAGSPKPGIDLSHESEAPFEISRYLLSFHTIDALQSAFFWRRKPKCESPDRSVAAFIDQAQLSEGVAGKIDCIGGRTTDSMTLIQLQYTADQFATKHMLFTNLIASCMHNYLVQDTARVRRSVSLPKPGTRPTKLLRRVEGGASRERTNILTLKEKEVLQWIVEGNTSREVGRILSMSERTVKFHLRNIYFKLNVVNRMQAVTQASKLRLL